MKKLEQWEYFYKGESLGKETKLRDTKTGKAKTLTMTRNDFLIALADLNKQLKETSDELFSLITTYEIEDSYKLVESLDEVINNIDEITGEKQ